MSELIVIGYDDPVAADNAQNTVQRLHEEGVVGLRGLAVVWVDKAGRTHVDAPSKLVGATLASGAVWGLVVGTLFLMPGVGLLAGAAVGGVVGSLGKAGVDLNFREQAQTLLTPGSAALVVMASEVTDDEFSAALRPHGGTVLKTSLSDEDEEELAQQLTGAAERSGGPAVRRPNERD